MKHFILGYGYCGFYLARYLIANNHEVTAFSRHLAEKFSFSGLNHQSLALENLNLSNEQGIFYYLAPPLEQGETDELLERFLAQFQNFSGKIVYFGSSAVYGDHRGQWVNESSPCFLSNSRQKRRRDAEQQIQQFALKHQAQAIILRTAGIYGPYRIPLANAQAASPVLYSQEAPFTNTIYVADLVKIAVKLALSAHEGIFNVADGKPHKMGFMQQHIAEKLSLPPAPFCSWQEAFTQASAMKREFLENSKRLLVSRLTHALDNYQFTSIEDGIEQSLNPKE